MKSKAGLKLNDISACDNTTYSGNNNSTKALGVNTTVISGGHKINLKVLDQLMKEKLKGIKA